MTEKTAILVDPSSDQIPGDAIWLESLDLSNIRQNVDSYRGHEPLPDKIAMRGVEYPHGIQVHGASEMLIELNGCAMSFHAIVGIDDGSPHGGYVSFEVWVDGILTEQTAHLTSGGDVMPIDIDLEHAQTLELVANGTLGRRHAHHANWAGAMLVLRPDAKEKPKTVPIVDETLPIAMGTDVRPSINHPRVTGATPGKPFMFKIPVSGEPPWAFSADGLPVGLVLDTSTGLITGELTQIGEWDVELIASNAYGVDAKMLKIVGGYRKLAQTPPMGWNSWNGLADHVTQEQVERNADAMVSSGLAAHGYQYINVDDYWMGERDENGKIQGNEHFPDMKGLADHIHNLGLKAGLYSSPGPKTCGRCEGSYNHELLDAETWAEWGYDFVKHDMCSYERKIPNKDHLGQQQKPYLVMRAALDAVDRDMVFSLCQYGWANVQDWGAKIGAQTWRTTPDVYDAWSSMAKAGFSQHHLSEAAGPGHWNDPDMLVVGPMAWDHRLSPCNLTKNEQITHMTLWSLLASPLLIGCDMTELDEFTLALLSNDEVIGVNQDPLGKQARRIYERNDCQVWAKLMSDGRLAVGLFNLNRKPTAVSVTWEQLGLTGKQNVRNLWMREDIGEFDDGFEAEIPRHGAMMLMVG